MSGKMGSHSPAAKAGKISHRGDSSSAQARPGTKSSRDAGSGDSARGASAKGAGTPKVMRGR